MASLTAKKIHGRTYYYLRECAWVDGKPKIVKQTYLGTAEAIVAALGKAPPGGLRVLAGAPVLEFGAVAALYDLAERLEITTLIDRHVPKRGRGPSVGSLLLLAALNRAVAATSKARLATWYDSTSLPRWMKLKAGQLTSQRFWDNMDRVPHEAIVAIERELSARIVKEFNLDPRCLFYDATNFFTFIDTFNTRSSLAQRGKSKEGRSSLRIVGLALLVTGDFEVPLLHHLYPGNHNDPTSFRSVVHELVGRYRLLSDGAQDITIVFDKGNNTEDTLEVIAGQYHVVGSLVPAHHPELLAVPRSKFVRLDANRFPDEVCAYRTTKKVFGRTFTVLVTYNENLFNAQIRTIEREVAKRQRKLRQHQAAVSKWHRRTRGGKAPTVGSVTKKVADILRGQHMKRLFVTRVTQQANGRPTLHYRFARLAFQRLQRTQLGKTILFTDNAEWSDEQIVSAYRGQHHVENAFRQMKDVHYVSFRPAHHWTDQKLRVHAFTCVLALLLCSLLRRELAGRGIDLSMDRMLETLATIREVQVLLSSGRGRPRLQRTHSKIEPLAARLFETLDLRRYLPNAAP
jgi:transposase